jgi:hypothetical protein
MGIVAQIRRDDDTDQRRKNVKKRGRTREGRSRKRGGKKERRLETESDYWNCVPRYYEVPLSRWRDRGL